MSAVNLDLMHALEGERLRAAARARRARGLGR